MTKSINMQGFKEFMATGENVTEHRHNVTPVCRNSKQPKPLHGNIIKPPCDASDGKMSEKNITIEGMNIYRGGNNRKKASHPSHPGGDLVRCKDCQHFKPNQAPGGRQLGLGSCLLREKYHPDRGQWPKKKHRCPNHQPKMQTEAVA